MWSIVIVKEEGQEKGKCATLYGASIEGGNKDCYSNYLPRYHLMRGDSQRFTRYVVQALIKVLMLDDDWSRLK